MTESRKHVWTVSLLFGLLFVLTSAVLVYFNAFEGRKKETETVSGQKTFAFTRYDHAPVTLTPGASGKETLILYTAKDDETLFQRLDSLTRDDSDVAVVFPFETMTKRMQEIAVAHSESAVLYGFDDQEQSLKAALGIEEGFLLFDKKGKELYQGEDWEVARRLYQADADYGIQEGDLIPDKRFACYLKEGSLSLREQLGHFTLINFWGTWCGPCVQEIPHFAEFGRNHPDASVLAVHSVSGKESALPYLEENKAWQSYPISFVQDPDDSFYDEMDFKDVYPMTIVLDEDNRIRRIHTGSVQEEDLESDYETYHQKES